MTIFVSALAAVVVVEMILLLPIVERARSMMRFSRKAGGVISAKHVSDTWKEKVLLRYSREILTSSMIVLLSLLLIAAVVGLADLLLRAAVGVSLVAALMSPLGLIVATAAAFLYVAVRKRIARG
jgi:hypothetical protein